MASEHDALVAENDKLRQSLFNLNKLFTDKFQAVALNDAAAQERDEARRRLADADRWLAGARGAAQELQELLSGDLLDDLHDQLSALAAQLADRDALLAERERAASSAEAQLQTVLAASANAREEAAAQHAQLEQSALQLRDAEERAETFRKSADAAMARVADLEEQLRRAEEAAAAAAAAAEEAAAAHEEHDTFDVIEIEKEEGPQRLEPVDFDEWKIKGLDDRSTGIMRLRHMLLDFRRPPATSLLESGEIRSLLQTVRHICVDRGLADSSVEPSPAQWLSFPEYVYAWFGNRPGVKSRASADGDCARFLHRLDRLKGKHHELATFHTLIDACEVDEVSYYVHARRVLLGLDHSSQLRIEVDRDAAAQACNVLIMRHARDEHAGRVRAQMTKSLLSSKSILTASGALDSAALLAGLLAVYKEEKLQLRAMLEVLHKAGANLRDYPSIHKVRAMLHSVDPDASDYEVLDIYQRCSIADKSRAHSSDSDPDAENTEPARTVPFNMLWVVLQRHGFLAKRQRIGMNFQPDLLHDPPAVRSCAADALASWLAAEPNVRALVKKSEGSELECERLWSQHAKHLMQAIETTTRMRKMSPGPELLFKLRRLLTSTFCAQSLRNDVCFPPANMRAAAEELRLMASVVKQRDLLADAAQAAPRSSKPSQTVMNKATTDGVPKASSWKASRQQEGSSRVRIRPVTPSLATKQPLECAPRPQSAIQ